MANTKTKKEYQQMINFIKVYFSMKDYDFYLGIDTAMKVLEEAKLDGYTRHQILLERDDDVEKTL